MTWVIFRLQSSFALVFSRLLHSIALKTRLSSVGRKDTISIGYRTWWLSIAASWVVTTIGSQVMAAF
jgi:uncharacterized membrane protein YecN with MAPEG domain